MSFENSAPVSENLMQVSVITYVKYLGFPLTMAANFVKKKEKKKKKKKKKKEKKRKKKKKKEKKKKKKE